MTQNLALQFGSFNFRLSSITKTRKTTKTTKKEHLFHSKNSLKKHHSFYRPEFTQHCKNYTPATHLKSLLTLQIFQQKCFWLFSEKKHFHCTIARRPRTTFPKHFKSKPLHISVYLGKKMFVPEAQKVFIWWKAE